VDVGKVLLMVNFNMFLYRIRMFWLRFTKWREKVVHK